MCSYSAVVAGAVGKFLAYYENAEFLRNLGREPSMQSQRD